MVFSVFYNHVGSLFRNHDRWRIGVAGHDGWHDRGIDDAQSGNPMDPQAFVDHGHDVGPHFACAGWMVDRMGDIAGAIQKFFVGFDP